MGAEYPEASLFSAPGLDEKLEDVRIDDVQSDPPPTLWKGHPPVAWHVSSARSPRCETWL